MEALIGRNGLRQQRCGLSMPPSNGVGVAEIRLHHVVTQVKLPLLADLKAAFEVENRLGDLAAPQMNVAETFERAREWQRQVGRLRQPNGLVTSREPLG